MSVYTPAIPQPGDRPSDSQPLILANFTSLNNIFLVNHMPLNASANLGKHTFIQFVPQAVGPVTAVGELALYTKPIGTGGLSEIFMRRASSGTEVLMTSFQDPVNAPAGSSFLPGGILIQWNISGTIPSGGDETELFEYTFGAVPYTVVITGIHNGGEVVSGNVHHVSAANFEIKNTSDSPRAFYWIAIGASA